jgi:O-antigen ligase
VRKGRQRFDNSLNIPSNQFQPEANSQEQFLLARLGQKIAIAGFMLYAVFAPHSIAGAEIALGIAAFGWLIRTVVTRKSGFSHTQFDLPILLFLLWTIASSFLSQEPQISIAKLQSVCVLLLFYLAQAILTRQTAIIAVCLMILSGVAGTIYSIYDLARGRGVVVESIANDSPFQILKLAPGDAIWRVGGDRVYSPAAIDDRIRRSSPGTALTVSLISQGEHAERKGLIVTKQMKNSPSPSGITGTHRTHRFRASGWTRHYETYSEILQILAQLSLGLALANLRNHGPNLRFKLAAIACSLLALGLALTAMRTVLVAFAIGAGVITIRGARGRARLLVPVAITLFLGIGVFFVWQARARNALWLQDASSSLRFTVARVGASRIMLHPFFGHGMDAMHLHWTEWGFPGNDMLDLHSTPLQLAFDRGLPALGFWLWIMATFWFFVTRMEKSQRDSSYTDSYGVLLGATGALAGFFVSSLVNYNFGDSEVALVFWWLMGTVVVLSDDRPGTKLTPGSPDGMPLA